MTVLTTKVKSMETTSGVTKTLKIADDTHEKLTKLGTGVGDTYDNVINRLTDEHNKIKKHILRLDRDELVAYELGKETMSDIVGKLVNEHNSGKERFKPHTA